MVESPDALRTLETLAGLLEGVAIDAQITRDELEGLQRWYAAHRAQLEPSVFNELRRMVQLSLQDERITSSHHRELLAYCRDFGAKHTPTHPSTRLAFARLQGMALGVLADGRLDDEEIVDLRAWLQDYAEYRHHFVFGAFFTMLDEVLRAGEITEEARARVRGLCETFGAPPPPRTLPAGFTPAPGPYDRPKPKRRWPPLPDPSEADFVTLDLETANDEPTSVCAMGVGVVRKGEISAVGAVLVDPAGPFDPRHVRIHGITAEAVRGAGRFADHFKPLAAALSGQWVLAHNATFTSRCLASLWWTLGENAPPPPRLLCTLRLARAVWPRADGYALDRLARTLEFTQPEHDPSAGARSCAELALIICERRRLPHPADVAAELGVTPIEIR